MSFFKSIPLQFWLLVLAIFTGSLRGMDDPDIWYQLLAGREFLSSMIVPKSDFYVYAGNGAPQMFGGWGFGTVYQFFATHFGLGSTSFLNSSIWSCAFAMGIAAGIIRHQRKLTDVHATQWFLISIIVGLLFISISPRVGMRAESTIWLGWTSMLLIYEWASLRKKMLMFLCTAPLISLGVSLLHTGGFLLIGAFLICAFQHMHHHNDQIHPWRLRLGWLASLCSLMFLPTLNPNGVDQPYLQLSSIFNSLIHTYHQPGMSIASAPAEPAHFINLEYAPIWDAHSSSNWSLFILASLCLCLVIYNTNKRTALEAVICVAFFLMAALHIRGLGFACLAMLVPAVRSAMKIGDELTIKISTTKLLGVTLLIPLLHSIATGRLGIQTDLPLVEVANIIKKSKPEGAHIFTMESGHQLAYVLGHDYKVSSLSHALKHNDKLNEHVNNVMLHQDKWETEFNQYQVKFACLPIYYPSGSRGTFYYLPKELALRDDWKFHPTNTSCTLFEKLDDDTKLTNSESLQQALNYFQNLYIITNLSHLVHDDINGLEISRQASERIKEIEAQIAYAKSIETSIGKPNSTSPEVRN